MEDKIVISNEQINLLNEKYGVKADPEDAQHYKLCQVILYLERKVLELSSQVS